MGKHIVKGRSITVRGRAFFQQVVVALDRDLLQQFRIGQAVLKLLVDRRRILFLEGIGQQYLAILRKLNQTVLAEVTTAVELNEAQQQAVKERVKAMTNANEVELELKLNSDLIGGVIIKVGSQVIDASLRGQLRRIGMSLSSST